MSKPHVNESEITASGDRRAWAAALMPIALHELNNATQFLSMLHSVTSSDPNSDVLEGSAANLARTGESVEDLGLLMAILSTAAGSDLLLERRSERGVAVVLAAVQKLVRKNGRDLSFANQANEVLTSSEGKGWELPWAVGAAVWLTANNLPESEALELSFEDEAWIIRCVQGPDIKRHATSVAEIAPLIKVSVEEGSWKLSPPSDWLRCAQRTPEQTN
jgi:hypothetical protein